jgi:hypothetical protein
MTAAGFLLAGVLQSDSTRLSQLRCHTAVEGHVYRKFSWGNLKSLIEMPKSKGKDPRQEVMDYYRSPPLTTHRPSPVHRAVLGCSIV